MRLVVLGGGGFIGSAVVGRLLLDGHQVRVLDRLKKENFRDPELASRVEWFNGDVFDRVRVDEALEGTDAVVHVVSSTSPKTSADDPIFDVKTNLVGSLQILDAMVRGGVKKIVFISSGGTVYGKVKYLPVDEAHPTDPLVSYGIVKLAIEKYLSAYEERFGIQAISLRVTNPYGEWQRLEGDQGVVGVFLRRVLTGQKIEVWGDGSTVRDFLYVGDVGDAVARALLYAGHYRVFNISSGEGTSLNELLRLIRAALSINFEVEYKMGRSFDIPVSVVSSKLAQNELGWVSKVSLLDGIERTASCLRVRLGIDE
ncbi:NAD-dependent epimerase/dehydratase family protein [Methylocystis sp. Sn-Cys]|uniref:NAD-dependent epimerase/dehydratase family protein n=1 Tax=Methylocystis sp. Sn-Cys TaxID=1701263 RepID=UPI001921E266|nr:NAD-dependent epimerase/dehydratase family protein [Methylocystis sp. Sn-Cys]MBL1258888.1 NAD-dependent epimerase/dehydratase family protein [Methylocystis sp. Sn-Cys]